MREVMQELREWRDAGEDVAIATVTETWGSSPRPIGSRMLVSASGKMAGSVSNGCIEGAVYQEAEKTLRDGKVRHLEYGVADDVAFEVGLACGGHIELLVQRAGPGHEEALRLLEAEQPFTLRTNLDDGRVELDPQPPRLELPRRDGGWFVEPYGLPPHLVIVGAIHIAIPLHRLAKVLGYRVTVIDARATFATEERFGDADRLIVAWPDEGLSGIPVDHSTAIVVLTHDPKFDMPALRSALATQAGYIGAIGSRKTNQNRFDALKDDGYAAGDIARIHGPIGLDLGGRDAESTALGIMAEIVATRFGGTSVPMREKKGRGAAQKAGAEQTPAAAG
ncbi:MAG: XdhC family protein [Candidatus Dormibacteraeota bacterium]|nr:XdhC family protein [Candidatus Dormibacteraeota bacterium]MBO0745396.1 XdhC family protein [Candidatus Dormibacteraeota bacterium]